MDDETKSIIRSLVASTPLKSTIRTILKDFNDTVGFHLPYKELGFSNPEQYLRSIPDVVQIIGSGINAEVRQVHSKKLAHINELVSKQRISTSRNKRPPRARVASSRPPPPRQRFPSEPTIAPSSTYYQYVNNNLPGMFSPQVNSQQQWNQQNPSYSRSPTKPYPEQRTSHSNNNTERFLAEPTTSQPRLYQSPVKQHPKPSFFQPQISSTPANEEVYTPVTKQPNVSPYIKKFVGKELLSVKAEDATFYDEVEERVPEEVKNNLRNLIGDHPEGIWCCDLPKLYKSRYLTNLDYAMYRFRTLNEMCLYLAGIFHYVRPDKGDFKLYDKRKPIPLDLSLEYPSEDDTVNAPRIADDLGIPDIEQLSVSDEPSNVVQYLEDIPRQWLSIEQTEGNYIDMWVAEVYDPSKFWFILDQPKLNKMMDELQIYYFENKHKYEVPPHKLKEGLYCCTVFCNEYHRAVVVAKSVVPTDDKIKVFFIDYGTVAKVPIKGICYLHRKFAVMPQQAIRGRLAGVFPPYAQQQWPREISTRFYGLVAKKELVARIQKINLQKQVVHLCLYEPPPIGSPDPPIDINGVLLNEGYAVSSPEEQETLEMNQYAIPIVRHLHLYPTFEELEQGLVPSAPDMINLLNNGCTLELIYPQYFRKIGYKHGIQTLRTKMTRSYSSEDSDSIETKSSRSGTTTSDDLKSSGIDELVNFTQAQIPDKGGTSSKTDTEAKILTQIQPTIKLATSEQPLTEEVYSPKPSSDLTVTKQEVVEDSLAPVALKPPPGFEGLKPCVQSVTSQPPNYDQYPHYVQQNYYFFPYQAGQYCQMPYGYPPQFSYNCLPPFLMNQQMAYPTYNPSPKSVAPIVTEYFNCLKNSRSTLVEAEKSESTGTDDSEMIACGTLAKEMRTSPTKALKEENVGIKIEEAETAKPMADKDVPEEISKITQKADFVGESTGEVKKKKKHRRKHKSSTESSQCEELHKGNETDEVKSKIKNSKQQNQTSDVVESDQSKYEKGTEDTATNKNENTRSDIIAESTPEEDIGIDNKSRSTQEGEEVLKLTCEVPEISIINKATSEEQLNEGTTELKTGNGAQENTSSEVETQQPDIINELKTTDLHKPSEEILEALIVPIHMKRQQTLIDEEKNLLDTSLEELDTVLSNSRPGSASAGELDALEKFLCDDTPTMQPDKIVNYVPECENKEKIEQTTECIMELNSSKIIKKKVISGKLMNLITWEQKQYLEFDEVLKTYTGLKLPVTSTKMRLARRNIFLKQIDVNLIDSDMKEEFTRHNLVSVNKFGKFVHLIELDQLPSFVKAFNSEMEVSIEDIL